MIYRLTIGRFVMGIIWAVKDETGNVADRGFGIENAEEGVVL